MSSHALRYPGLTSADVAIGGRHRRPESPAATGHRFAFDESPRVTFDDTPPVRHGRVVAVPLQRDEQPGARHRTATGTISRPARHTASHRAPPTRPPATGSHRAPGTLPIESWLLMGKKRQQLLLASLVAVGLLLVALPSEHGQETVDPVNAAAQRAAETEAAKKAGKDPAHDTQAGSGRDAGAPAPGTSASAGTPNPSATGAAQRTGTAGPGHSLRTTGTSAVALTFDDGPDPEQTPRILALLDQYGVKATFCLVGQQVQKHPEMVRQIVAAGHTLCNHTWNHSLTIGKDQPAKIREDLARTSDAIQAAVPGVRVPFFRAPGGNFTDRLVSVAAESGMTSLYWEVDPRDWDHPDGETDAAHITRVVSEVKKHVKSGSIVLSHDFNQPDTIAAYEQLLPWLADRYGLGIPGEPAPPVKSAPPPATTEPSPGDTQPTPAPSASTTPGETPDDAAVAPDGKDKAAATQG